MFISKNQVRMHDTDMAGILYFARQFRFVHDALEDLFEAEGFKLQELFDEQPHVFVIVHVEADYLKSLKVGDRLEVHVGIEKIGESSLTLVYKIYRGEEELVGTAKTVHVCVERAGRTKAAIPQEIRARFAKYFLGR